VRRLIKEFKAHGRVGDAARSVLRLIGKEIPKSLLALDEGPVDHLDACSQDGAWILTRPRRPGPQIGRDLKIFPATSWRETIIRQPHIVEPSGSEQEMCAPFDFRVLLHNNVIRGNWKGLLKIWLWAILICSVLTLLVLGWLFFSEGKKSALIYAVYCVPSDYREVLHLRNMESLSHKKIAERMEKSPAAVRMLWIKALRELRRTLKKSLGGSSL
jgi:hypothetical protein